MKTIDVRCDGVEPIYIFPLWNRQQLTGAVWSRCDCRYSTGADIYPFGNGGAWKMKEECFAEYLK